MTPYAAKSYLMRLVNAHNPDTDDARLHEDVAVCLNRAFQVAWDSPYSDGFRRQSFSLSTVVMKEGYELDKAIQKVLRAKCGGVSLSETLTKDNLAEMTERFPTNQGSTGQPSTFYLDRQYPGDNHADSFTVTLRLAPIPIKVQTLSYDATVEPPQYTACELNNDELELPFPHGKVESILIPIAAYYLTQTNEFDDQQRLAQLRDGYQEARVMLGLQEVSEGKAEAA